jgi:hypothetical protein
VAGLPTGFLAVFVADFAATLAGVFFKISTFGATVSTLATTAFLGAASFLLDFLSAFFEGFSAVFLASF